MAKKKLRFDEPEWMLDGFRELLERHKDKPQIANALRERMRIAEMKANPKIQPRDYLELDNADRQWAKRLEAELKYYEEQILDAHEKAQDDNRALHLVDDLK